MRELREESTLRARVDRQLLAGEHNGREARYFVMTDVEGSPALSGPELAAHAPDNSFELRGPVPRTCQPSACTRPTSASTAAAALALTPGAGHRTGQSSLP